MKVILTLVIILLLIGCTKTADVSNDQAGLSNVAPEVSEPEQPDDYTDIQTALDDFDAIEETLDDLE